MRSKNARMVATFRNTFGKPVRSFPDVFAADLELHSNLLAEEVSETLIAVKDRDAEEILDGLVDLVYVAYGAALDMGVDLDAAFERVHAANMQKLGADGKPIIDAQGKIRKPDGWQPPVLTDLVHPR